MTLYVWWVLFIISFVFLKHHICTMYLYITYILYRHYSQLTEKLRKAFRNFVDFCVWIVSKRSHYSSIAQFVQGFFFYSWLALPRIKSFIHFFTLLILSKMFFWASNTSISQKLYLNIYLSWQQRIKIYLNIKHFSNHRTFRYWHHIYPH